MSPTPPTPPASTPPPGDADGQRPGAWPGDLERGAEWLRGEGASSDVVLSSRVRLARNIEGLPFTNRATARQLQEILDRSRGAIVRIADGGLVRWVDLHQSSVLERTALVERHLISQQLARGKLPQPEASPAKPGAAAAAAGGSGPGGAGAGGVGGAGGARAVAFTLPDERLSIMVNEEDHLRLQSIRSGLSLTEAYEAIDRVDDQVEESLEYAFHPRLGYLTACPTNVGTGARFSAMLHLPGLRMSGNIDKAKRAATDMALTVRGFYGEGSEASGDFYQFSNQTTLGKTERMLMDELERDILPKIVEFERGARKALVTKHRAALEDQCYRALGLLTHARLLKSEEATPLLSMVRLGVVLGVVKGIDLGVVTRLLLLIQPAHLQLVAGRELDQDKRRVARAELVRRRLMDAGH